MVKRISTEPKIDTYTTPPYPIDRITVELKSVPSSNYLISPAGTYRSNGGDWRAISINSGARNPANPVDYGKWKMTVTV